jgi:polysaccharide deacetylase 2 family uncharacterized protein YibQ
MVRRARSDSPRDELDTMTSELSAPLGRRRARAAKAQAGKPRRHLPVARLAFAGIGALLLAITLRVIFVDDPHGGQPYAEVAINSTHNSNSIVGAAASSGPQIDVGPEFDPATGAGSIITLEGAETRTANLQPASVADRVPDPITGVLADLVEETEHGQIPRMSATGERPFDLYSRPSVSAAAADGKPRIAIIVTGLGINAAGSLDAASKLPDNVTLAFAPYGKGLADTTGAARAAGHELFLEVPLEPFDYPDNDPGPDTLLTGKAPRDNMSKLFAVMGKFGGYAGLINNMGARFTASGADFGPMMEELGARGLGYVDDGSSNRSLAAQLSAANKVPFARADLMLDANPSRAAILNQLTQLEEKARTGGSALGIVSALPISISTLAEWTQTLEARGFMLVPASALMK